MLEARTNMEKVERMGTKSRGRMERGENEKKFAQTNSGDRATTSGAIDEFRLVREQSDIGGLRR